MTMKTQRIKRVVYLSGPVDAVDVYEKWSKEQQLGYFGSSHMREFFDVCARLGLDAYVITTLPGAFVKYESENILIENHPPPTRVQGVLYHLTYAWWLFALLPRVVRFRPDVLVATAGVNYWFLLILLRLSGIIIVPVLTCTLWPKFAPLRPSWRFLLYLNKIFFVTSAKAINVMSEDIAVQVRYLLAGKKIQIATFLPVYARSQFSMFHAAQFHVRPFNIFFAGRIETNKGVYDLVKMAQWLEQHKPGAFHFDICGEGSELDALRGQIQKLGLAGVMVCHGFCERRQMSELLDKASVVIVPTTTEFEEGFNMVCAEAILAGRPLITSPVCPALTYVKDAAVEVPPDDFQGYCQAILKLAFDEEFFESKRQACKSAQEKFYDPNNGWGAKLTAVLKSL
jgi:glycogen(starch) synthase